VQGDQFVAAGSDGISQAHLKVRHGSFMSSRTCGGRAGVLESHRTSPSQSPSASCAAPCRSICARNRRVRAHVAEETCQHPERQDAAMCQTW